MQYIINQPIRIRYLELNKTSGITDLKIIVQPPIGVEITPIDMVEIDGQGVYEASFVPDVVGWYWVRVKSIFYPANIYSKSYYVGNSDNPYPAQEDGKLTSLDTKLGEVQIIPTANTLLRRLKDLWDKLNSLFTDGIAKVKLWDGINQVTINTSGRLLVSQEPPTPPAGTTGVNITSYSWVSSTDNNIYIIPEGTTLNLQRFSAAGGDDSYIAIIELWYDPLGTGVGMTIIDVIFSFASSSQHDLTGNYIGDGIKSIRMRRRSASSKPIEIFGRWEGYYQ